MKKKLLTTFEGNTYDILMNISGWSGKTSITINGETKENVQKLPQTFGCVIYPILLGEKEAQLVMRNGKLSVAVDGVSIEDGKEIDKGVKPPWWIYIFIVINSVLVFTGGGLGAAAGAGFGMFSYLFACKKEKSNTAKFFVALGCTAAAWVIWLIAATLVSSVL